MSADELAAAVAELGALPVPVPVGPEPQALSSEQRAQIATLIGAAKPATDQLLLEMAQQIRDRREHDHSTAADWDWYCLNASGWLGDKAPTVLRRLLDAEARVAELEAERHSTNEALTEITVALREKEAAPLTVFRASHESIVMGLYGNRQAAMDHVHATLGNEEGGDVTARVIWRADDPEADEPTWECWLFDADMADDSPTGYVVEPMEVASAHDLDADE